jgi:pseudouridine-5'-phosphate glycosidase
MTAVLDGVAVAGVEAHEVERVLGGTAKTSSRDLPVAPWPALAQSASLPWRGSLAIAHQVGIAVFATGGIGGVHRGSERTGDVSADLGALALYSVCTVTAGAKAFLDLGKTVEYLDTLGVPLLGYQTDYFPAFYSRSSGRSVQARVETASEVAAIIARCPRVWV